MFSIFQVFFAFHAISNIKKNWCRKKNPGGGCGFFCIEKQLFLISRSMLFSTLKKNIEKCPFTYWLNGRWFLQIVERDSWNLYTLYPLFPCSDFVSQMWGWFGGGGGVMFFLYAGNIVKCPFTYSYWLNGRWFLQIVHIGRLEILKSSPSLTG